MWPQALCMFTSSFINILETGSKSQEIVLHLQVPFPNDGQVRYCSLLYRPLRPCPNVAFRYLPRTCSQPPGTALLV
jgi:hypothetical protein